MAFGSDYAKEYDKFYKGKDYGKEVMFLYKMIGDPPKNILDIACGTGNHAIRLRALGYNVTGQDISPAMIKIAKSKSDQVKWRVRDMVSTKDWCKHTMDAVICMFAAMDYITKSSDIKRMLGNVHWALKPNGIFIFDFWNKSAVEKYYKPISKSKLKTSYTTLDKKEGVACVTQVFSDHEKMEHHFLKYHALKEMKLMLEVSGFKVKMFPFMHPDTKITDSTWNIQVVAKK